jgi:hypothetical protein
MKRRVIQKTFTAKIGKRLCKECPYCMVRTSKPFQAECVLFREGKDMAFATTLGSNDNGDVWRCKECLDS